MTATVIKLVKNAKTAKSRKKNPANPEVVRFLKTVLHDAKKGHIQAVFVVGTGDDMIYSGWTPPDSVFSMLGGIENTKVEFQAKEIEVRDA